MHLHHAAPLLNGFAKSAGVKLGRKVQVEQVSTPGVADASTSDHKGATDRLGMWRMYKRILYRLGLLLPFGRCITLPIRRIQSDH